MKNLTPRILQGLFLACLITLAIAHCGCTTTPATVGPTGEIIPGHQVADIPRIAATIQELTTDGVSQLLAAKPDTMKPLSTSLEELTALESQDAITPAQLLTILNKLPVKQFSGPKGAIAFSSAKLLLAATGISTMEITKLNELKPIVSAFKQGLLNAGVVAQ